MSSRRNFLRLLGGGVVVAAAGGGAFLATRTPAAALAPWDDAGAYSDPRLRALSFAILAPNPHNRQPWVGELIGEDALLLHRDPERNLPETDPFDRQIFVGLGCFLEQLTIAASTTGHSAEISLFPDGDDGPVAKVTFLDGATPDPLAPQIPDRRSCKEPFEDRALPSDAVAALASYGTVLTDPDMVAKIRKLTWDAWETEALTPRTYKESVDLMRFGKAEINANPDGIDMGGALFESLILIGAMSREVMLDTTSTTYKEGFSLYRDMLEATPAFVTLTSPANTRTDQIDAGRRWLRLNLKTTELGLALHPVSQALQEFPEMAPHYEMAHNLLAGPGETVQMLGRLGFGPTVPKTPRWPLETRLKDGQA